MLDLDNMDPDDLLAAERWRLQALVDRHSGCDRTLLCRELLSIQEGADTLMGAADWRELHEPGYCPDCGRLTYS